jgi:DNA-directed RNA polymerase
VASASLAEVIIENSLDVILIQEPFAKGHLSPAILNIPPGYIAFHCLSHEHAFGAAVLVKHTLAKSFRAVNRSCFTHIAAVDLLTPLGFYRFISLYFRPSVTNISFQFDNGLSNLFTNKSIIEIDSNSLSKLWNSKSTNVRGLDLEFLISKHFLNILNIPLNQLDFVPPGTSFLDVSLVGRSISHSRWFYPSIPSFSDHPYIYFEIVGLSSSHVKSMQSSTKPVVIPHVSRLCLDSFRNTVKHRRNPIQKSPLLCSTQRARLR